MEINQISDTVEKVVAPEIEDNAWLKAAHGHFREIINLTVHRDLRKDLNKPAETMLHLGTAAKVELGTKRSKIHLYCKAKGGIILLVIHRDKKSGAIKAGCETSQD
ncbi:hypothetical protein CEXT_43631 [Caerostris extrusa]|uniref:Uncharacterized protein n=1 Tax=Caerostris extrusa TaxID=172846 RepID=A0AAV4NJH0_CAEEX|nr:hypothetical protein CEXT_43631 [Caerostris extrusa]